MSFVPFEPRPYQEPVVDAIESLGRYQRVMAILPRRSGKDIVAFNLAVRWALRETCNVLYCFPTYRQAKQALWDAVTHEGTSFFDFIPKFCIASTNSQELKIKFVNGSTLHLVGTDRVDALRGMSCKFAVFSEYADQNPDAYFKVINPMLRACKGSALFISTPKSKNHMYRLHYDIALQNPDEWFVHHLTVEDTKHMSPEELAKERKQLSYQFFQQEYMCSYDHGVTAQFYCHELQTMKFESRITDVPYLPELPAYTSWDLGFNSPCAIIMYQIDKADNIRIFDCYDATNQGLDHFAKVLQTREYRYTKHFLPHDAKVHDPTNRGQTRAQFLAEYGVRPSIIAPRVGFLDGLEKTRRFFKRIYMDKNKCERLLTALENYHSDYDAKNDRYTDKPVENFATHYADALRYAAVCSGYLKESKHKDELSDYNKHLHHGSTLPPQFNDPPPNMPYSQF